VTFDIAAVYDGVVVGRPAETEIVVPAKRGEADAYEASGPRSTRCSGTRTTSSGAATACS